MYNLTQIVVIDSIKIIQYCQWKKANQHVVASIIGVKNKHKHESMVEGTAASYKIRQ